MFCQQWAGLSSENVTFVLFGRILIRNLACGLWPKQCYHICRHVWLTQDSLHSGSIVSSGLRSNMLVLRRWHQWFAGSSSSRCGHGNRQQPGFCCSCYQWPTIVYWRYSTMFYVATTLVPETYVFTSACQCHCSCSEVAVVGSDCNYTYNISGIDCMLRHITSTRSTTLALNSHVASCDYLSKTCFCICSWQGAQFLFCYHKAILHVVVEQDLCPVSAIRLHVILWTRDGPKWSTKYKHAWHPPSLPCFFCVAQA